MATDHTGVSHRASLPPSLATLLNNVTYTTKDTSLYDKCNTFSGKEPPGMGDGPFIASGDGCPSLYIPAREAWILCVVNKR
jgi:hypothetical protein